MDQAINGDIIPLINDEIIAEYEEVLHRSKFKFDNREIRVVIDSITRRGIPVDGGPIDEYVPDPKDVVFYSVVIKVREEDEDKDPYLVTGNRKHFPLRSFVVSPKEMFDLILQSNGPLNSQTDDQVEEQTEGQSDDQVEEQTEGQSGDQVEEQAEDQLKDQTEP